jgi:hypothetical protein
MIALPRLRRMDVTASSEQTEISMAKIDLDSLSIEELAALRDHASDKLAEKVAARQAELEAELDRLAQYGKSVKKSQATPVAKPKKDDLPKSELSADVSRAA